MRKRNHHLRDTRNITSNKLDYILLGVILLVAAVLRLWKLGQVPFMHDEFSAWFRLQYDNFHDLIKYGVGNDSHPAGVQVFLYYWTRLVGWNEFWVKLPFALLGIASIYLIFRIGQQWFNNKVGLLAAAFFAVSQYAIFHSQLARPYSAGLFFILLQVYFWNRILFDSKKPSLGIWIGFALATWLSALMHYFSIAQAGLIFVTGLFFLPKDRRKGYWLSGAAAVLLFCPTLPTFYDQLFVKGGIGGWLSKPESTFLTDFLQYTMNYAPLFIFATGIAIILPLILGKREKRHFPIRWAVLAWFVIIFVMAYVYSLLREPILQYSTLLFSYPFLIIIAFSLYRNVTMTKVQTVAVVLALLFIGSSSLIVNRQHYDTMYHQGYDQIAKEMKQDYDSLQDIHFATTTEYYQLPDFYQSQTDVTNRVFFDRENTIQDFRQYLNQNDSHLLGFGWTDYADPIWETEAVGAYPWLVRENTWFTSRYLTLSSDSIQGAQYQLHQLSQKPQRFVNNEWCGKWILQVDSLERNTDILGVVANIHAEDTVQGCVLVMELHDIDTDTTVLWHGSHDITGTLYPGENILVDAIRFNQKDFTPQGMYLKTFIWNQQKGTITLDKLSYYCSSYNPRLNSLYKPLQKNR